VKRGGPTSACSPISKPPFHSGFEKGEASVGLGDEMKRFVAIIIILGAVVAAYLVGHSRGRSSGFEDGAVWAGQSADLCKGMRALAILGVLEQTNYTRVAEALQHDIDYAIIGALRAEEHLAGVSLPREIRKQNDSIQEAFKTNTGAEDHTGFSVLADFRREHPSPSRDRNVLDAVDQLLEKH
jgi:hypothetical protein